MLARVRRPLVALPWLGAGAILVALFATQGAAAQSATGTVTGRVLWGACVRSIPLPLTPDGQPQAQPGAPDAQAQPAPGVIPVPGPGALPGVTNGLPAGAVLVAVQNTGVSARTDESGRFTLAGVPAGLYLTVAAGPVANSAAAIAERPNVQVNGGQSMDIGTLSLGSTSNGMNCRLPVGVGSVDSTAPQVQPSPSQTP